MEHAVVFRLIVGLGNPGRRYVGTRHNVGFLVLDELARRQGTSFSSATRWHAEMSTSGDPLLMKPQTFMNLSGQSVGNFVRFRQIDPSEVLVVFDDTALPLGDLRLRRSGSAGGHNGLQSVIDHLGTNTIPRLRVGIGAALGRLENHVLGTFSQDELPVMAIAVDRAADAVAHTAQHGFEDAMNLYNKKQTI